MNTQQSVAIIMIVAGISKHDMVGRGINRVRRIRHKKVVTSNTVYNRDASGSTRKKI